MPIDLRAKYRIGVDESYQAETRSTRQANTDPWNWQILGRRGHARSWSDDHVAVCVDGHRNCARNLVAHPAVVKVQDGTDGVNAVVRNEDLESVIHFIKPYLRKKISDEQRARLVAMTAGFNQQARQDASKSTLKTHATTSDDSQVLQEVS